MPTLTIWTLVLPGVAHLQPCHLQRLDQPNQKAPARNPCSDSDCLTLPFIKPKPGETMNPLYPHGPHHSTLNPKTELTSLLRRLHIGVHHLVIAAAEAPEVCRKLRGGLHKGRRLRL